MATNLTKPFARYAHTRAVGDLVFVAGQGARHPPGHAHADAYAGVTRNEAGRVVAHDTRAQSRAVLANVERALTSAGLARRDLVDVTVFLTDMTEFEQMNEVWNEFFADQAPPTRTTVCVSELPGDNFVEMKAVAARAAAAVGP